MAEGILTEKEWRKKRQIRVRPSMPGCWGAQCVIRRRKASLHQNRLLHTMMLTGAFLLAVGLPVCVPVSRPAIAYPVAAAPQAQVAPSVRSVSGIGYRIPSDLPMESHTYTIDQLLRGKLLLIDKEHPLPAGIPPSNCQSIVNFGKGMVPVHDLTLKSGKETIQALSGLFETLRKAGAGGFYVRQATQTADQQQALQLACMRKYSQEMPLDSALLQANEHTDPEMLQEYTVELRLGTAGFQTLDERPLEETAQGRQLLHFAWRHGFVRTHAAQGGATAFLFRYVGEAHATAMTYLDVDLSTYLDYLHEKGTLVIRGENHQLHIIQCKPMEGSRVEFHVPKGTSCEVSLDNTGYAVAACTISE